MANFRRPRRFPGMWPLLFCALLFALVAAPERPAAARQSPTAESPAPLQSSSDLVAVDVSVLDRAGNFSGGLDRANFRILDNGSEKPVQFFAPVYAPAHVMVLVETGPAVFLIHEEHIAALAALLDGLAPDDQAAVFAYAESARQIAPFTADKTALRNAIDDTQYIVGMDQLNFYDSLSAVIGALSAGNGKEAIVVLSTGLDSGPASHWDLLASKLRRTNVVIFPVALGGFLRGDGASAPGGKKKKSKRSAPGPPQTPAFARADQVLRSLAQITGGKAYFPQTPADFAPAYREIAATLRHEYVLAFAPDRDGSFHTLSIEILDARGQTANRDPKSSQYRAFYREGYSAPGP